LVCILLFSAPKANFIQNGLNVGHSTMQTAILAQPVAKFWTKMYELVEYPIMYHVSFMT
jgi:hypothetical protein